MPRPSRGTQLELPPACFFRSMPYMQMKCSGSALLLYEMVICSPALRTGEEHYDAGRGEES